ncbi:M10 family metallopeptidase C-terminal domain-containing protein [Flexibacterium corallicola]|uniref:M10 family metallopeptidase C-terminal domain-containing protein n=1 Tax=Flexibacterium corallicola TaxID=3037259 RepID=UPI00286FADE3|nr:M10 family metallopeptidase C-terminal domain-containing protein [Pseudovibrio sp. M1P-2-3]
MIAESFIPTFQDSHAEVTSTEVMESNSTSQVQVLTASDEVDLNYFGGATATNSDGTIVVGAPGHFEISGNHWDEGKWNGLVYIYEPDGNGNYIEKSISPEPDNTQRSKFGYSVDINDSGVIAVGSPGNRGGSVYIYTEDENSEYSTVKLTNPRPDDYSRFGDDIAIGEDGTLVVGAKYDDSDGNSTGSVYVYTPGLNGDYSSEPIRLSADDIEDQDYFGSSVEVGPNGMIIVGSPYDDDQVSGSGSIYVFTPDGNGGYNQVKLAQEAAAMYDRLGTAIAVNVDGTIVASAPFDNDQGSDAGSVTVFTLDGNGEYQAVELYASDAQAYDNFGSSVAISDNGIIVVAATGEDELGDSSGAVYVFVPSSDGSYTEYKLTEPSGSDGGLFGSAVSIDDDGVIVVGAQHTEGTGASYLFHPNSDGSYGEIELVDPDTFTNDQIADQLTDGYWESIGRSSRSFDVAPGDTITVSIDALTSDGQYLATAALDAWAMVTGINFQAVSGSAQITFDDNNSGAYTASGVAGDTIAFSNVNISTDWLTTYGTTLNSYSFQTYVHEIGHAMGLGHAGNYDGAAVYGVDNHYTNDSWQTSVMSYFTQPQNTSIEADFAYILTPTVADILAMQNLYGTANNLRIDDTVYGENSTVGGYYDNIAGLQSVAYTIIDNGGDDTIDYSSVWDDQLISLEQETYSNVNGLTGNLAIARGTVIENVISGHGNDILIGNEADNTLVGGAGSDTFVFDTNSGADEILDFSDGLDLIEFEGGISSFAELTITDQGDDTFVTFDGGSILLTGVDITQLSSDDFLFA